MKETLSRKEFIEILEERGRNYYNWQSAVKNALCRYQQAIPKGGAR